MLLVLFVLLLAVYCTKPRTRHAPTLRAKLLNTHQRKADTAVVSILQLVFCTAADFEWRQLHRKTWIAEVKRLGLRSPYLTKGGKPIGISLEVRFVMGSLDALQNKHLRAKVLEENATTADLVALPEMAENMNRGKTHATYRWAFEQYGSSVDFIGKSDLDTYLFWPMIVALLPVTGHYQPIFFGQSHPTKEHCAEGGFYMLSRPLARFMASEPIKTTFKPWEKNSEDLVTCAIIKRAEASGMKIDFRMFSGILKTIIHFVRSVHDSCFLCVCSFSSIHSIFQFQCSFRIGHIELRGKAIFSNATVQHARVSMAMNFGSQKWILSFWARYRGRLLCRPIQRSCHRG